ncbi:MAG: hypothetical protein ACE5ES_00135 [Candidatus Nanoarchaeia archaeon]
MKAILETRPRPKIRVFEVDNVFSMESTINSFLSNIPPEKLIDIKMKHISESYLLVVIIYIDPVETTVFTDTTDNSLIERDKI